MGMLGDIAMVAALGLGGWWFLNNYKSFMGGGGAGAGVGAGGGLEVPVGEGEVPTPTAPTTTPGGKPIVNQSLRDEMAAKFKLSSRTECLELKGSASNVKKCECVDFKGYKIANCTYKGPKGDVKCNSASCVSEASRKKLNFKCTCTPIPAEMLAKYSTYSPSLSYPYQQYFSGAAVIVAHSAPRIKRKRILNDSGFDGAN